jgi:hypothetical protein
MANVAINHRHTLTHHKLVFIPISWRQRIRLGYGLFWLFFKCPDCGGPGTFGYNRVTRKCETCSYEETRDEEEVYFTCENEKCWCGKPQPRILVALVQKLLPRGYCKKGRTLLFSAIGPAVQSRDIITGFGPTSANRYIAFHKHSRMCLRCMRKNNQSIYFTIGS